VTAEVREREPAAHDGVGLEPDPRVTFANERTLLAWNRTALAAVATGLAVAQFVDAAGAELALALPLILIGAATPVAAYRRWRRNERCLRAGHAPPVEPAVPRAVAVAFAVTALGAAVLALAHLAG